MELIIFDCDGVLINSEDIHTEAEITFLAEIGVPYEREDYVARFMGMSPHEWENKIATDAERRLGEPLPQNFFHDLHDYVAKGFEESLAPLPKVRETIRDLSFPFCVASSSPIEQLHWKLRRTGLHDLFDPHIFSGQMVERGKPAPDLFLHAAKVCGSAPSACLVLEDSANGVKAAKAAGMTAIGFTLGNHCGEDHGDQLLASGADAVISSYTEFADLVRAFA